MSQLILPVYKFFTGIIKNESFQYVAYLTQSKVLLTVLCCLTTGLITLPNEAKSQVRIATVDMSRILNESSEAKTRRKELDSLSSTARKKIDSKKNELKALEGSLQKERNEEIERQYREEARELSRLVKDEEDELRAKFVSANRELTQKALSLVRNYATKEGVDLVLDKSSVDRGTVLFSLEKVDITEAILQQLDN
jgi:outer membrane protein